MNVQFTPNAWADYRRWIETDPKALKKIAALIEDIRRSPFSGLGKPEPLKENWAGWWSRRIDEQHRLVYRVEGRGSDQTIVVALCRGHY